MSMIDADVLWKDVTSNIEYCFDFLEIIERQPTIEPEPKWIPCSEKLPDVRQWVLCQCRAGIMDVLRLTEDGSWNKNYPHTEYMSGFVTAWMPLPTAYQEEGEER